MSIRLYDTAWIELEGHSAPVQVRRDTARPEIFRGAGFEYDIDGRPKGAPDTDAAPRVIRILNLQTVRETGLTMMAHEVPVAHIAVHSVKSAVRGTHQKLLEIA